VSLIRREHSLLLVVDTQEGFYGPERDDVDRAAFGLCIDRVAWVTGLARALEVPVVVTEEDPGTNGPTARRVLERLPDGSPVLTKPVFGAGANPPILAALAASARQSVVLAGLETDVCIAHSAITLAESGHRVAAVVDALFSPGEAHRHGLRRLRAEGVQLVSAKELFYDWTCSLDGARAVLARAPGLEPPPGFSL
jgi:nicotinamidase-related amidase